MHDEYQHSSGILEFLRLGRSCIRARLQSCRKSRKMREGFSPCGPSDPLYLRLYSQNPICRIKIDIHLLHMVFAYPSAKAWFSFNLNLHN